MLIGYVSSARKGVVMATKTVIVGDLNEVSMVSTYVTFDDEAGYKLSDVIKVTPGFNKGIEYVLPTLVRQVRNAISRARHENVVGIAVATAGEVDPKTGVVLSAPVKMPGWAGVNLRKAFEEAFDLPVSVIGEVEANVLGEARWGADGGKDDCLVVNVASEVIGSFLKGGIIQKGLEQVEHLGKAPLEDGKPLESRASVEAIIDHYGDIGGDRVFGHDKRRPKGYAMSAVEMDRRATMEGEELVIEAMRWGGEPLGRAIAALDLGVDEVLVTGHAVELGSAWADAVKAGLGEGVRLSLGGVSDRMALVGAAESVLRPAFE